MSESTTDIRIVPLPDEPGRADRPPPGRGPAAAGPGRRGRGRRLDRRPRPPQGRGRTPPGRPQRPPPRADHPDRPRATIEVKQPRVHDRQARRPAGEVHLGRPAALPAADQEPGGADPLALPQGRQHRRLLRGPPGDPRPRRPGPLGHDRHPAQGRLGGATIEAWSKRSLAGKQYVYVWADGVHFNIRLEEGRQCILVLMGATAEGKKELIAIADGYRESEQSWKELLLDVQGPWPGGRAAPGDRRRGVGVLEGDASGLGHDEGAAVLGAQDGERAGQAAQGRASRRPRRMLHEIYQAESEGRGREGVRPVREDVRGEVPEGDGVPGQGPGGVAGVLRLPGGALGAHPDDEPDRERVRDGAAAARQDEGEREPGGVPDDGVQADGVASKRLAIVERFAAAARGRQGDRLHRRHQGEARRLPKRRPRCSARPATPSANGVGRGASLRRNAIAGAASPRSGSSPTPNSNGSRTTACCRSPRSRGTRTIRASRNPWRPSTKTPAYESSAATAWS